MEHVVFFSEESGRPEFRRVADLAEAVRLVESLRNERGIVDVAVHALTPVPLSFRTYYRVEVAAGEAVAADAAPSVAAPSDSDATPDENPSQLLAALTAEDAAAADDVVPSVAIPDLALDVEPAGVGDGAESFDARETFDVPETSDVPAALDAPEAFEVPVPFETSEAFVPQVRPEPEPERSLGYFAR